MMDTLNVQSALRYVVAISALVWAVLPPLGRTQLPQSGEWEGAMETAARMAPEARVLVVRIGNGHVIAARHLREAATTLAAPGSTLKPIVLYEMLKAGRWNADQRVVCPGDLRIGAHRLACSHPVLEPFSARAALAWSCNAYFAQVARAVPSDGLAAMLGPTGLLGRTGLARDETSADFRPPRTPEEMQLAVLGVEGIRVSPLELAGAYRWLARGIKLRPEGMAESTVLGGLKDSAAFGMAKASTLRGATVAGKTGTAEGSASQQTHGWFVGLTPAEKPQFVVVVYLPAGGGSDAARVAGELLAQAPGMRH